MADTATLQIDDQGIATITINRPEVHNAFDVALIAELTARGRIFSAGAGLDWMRRSAGYSDEGKLG